MLVDVRVLGVCMARVLEYSWKFLTLHVKDNAWRAPVLLSDCEMRSFTEMGAETHAENQFWGSRYG